jgi:branched-chain amino acid transport system permease protein
MADHDRADLTISRNKSLVLPLSKAFNICLGLAAVASLPYVTSFNIATEILIFGILATGFNLLLGYTGLFSWGQATFFGAGAYVAGNLLLHWHMNWLVVLAGGAATGAVVALVVGWFSTRTRGLYFILMTMAFNQVAFLIATTWRSVTGGNNGLQGVPRVDLDLGFVTVSLQNPLAFYWFTAVVFLSCYFVFKLTIESPVGLVFRGIKENEDRMLAIGYKTNRYKVLAILISGSISGIAGSLYALHWGLVPISSIDLLQSSNIVFMSILGGVGHPIGPIIGAGVYIYLRDVISSFWPRWPLILGVVIIAVVFFLRGGLMEGWALVRRGFTQKG